MGGKWSYKQLLCTALRCGALIEWTFGNKISFRKPLQRLQLQLPALCITRMLRTTPRAAHEKVTKPQSIDNAVESEISHEADSLRGIYLSVSLAYGDFFRS
ncbi:unnamed protein product [Ceratitis capitata]|uniref:(Mediterranean fruit fly) hypothetical protein n=1 Tax=Ceratitis capitata TaxID=7213 RepID=A0A811VFV9_CERCA|nr:unnamed protein product [Ceratitis capitata]